MKGFPQSTKARILQSIKWAGAESDGRVKTTLTAKGMRPTSKYMGALVGRRALEAVASDR